MSSRRSQAERTEATTGALLDAARRLFAADGFDATSLAAVAAQAGVTKGALYHHFDNKARLFEAVFTREIDRLAQSVLAAYRGRADPWDAFCAACRAFLQDCCDPPTQRIVLIEAFSAIGWTATRRLETPLLELMCAGIAAAVAAGRIDPRPAEPFAHFLFGALCETALTVARSDDPPGAHRDAVAEVDRVLGAMAVRSGQ
ncbi:TetR family transcriptional regulator [Mycolicibacterium duvalii]|uniref:TetR family transcriptional regulator n=1 Tax=Mycolicibacterium duvalii TaxID=39688 RepID=A0A7I7JY60_9MYCO|nr:TetR/AcrR family transcriptional regulator [Mycolicibacterium duvalii]MCV7368775.1 TetR/AcrR family transcriptional regulator [Mycolicibacterium duvalii]PEG38631.1 TetR family transcriptional regulator [Mycolicibacterium duvalii]BBX16847.1 TetR family transcriptional regulator [Mycolicibacterium duvalii]